LPNVRKGDMLNVKNGRYVCPVCMSRLDQPVSVLTQAENLPLWCRKCKSKIVVNIDSGRCSVVSRCP